MLVVSVAEMRAAEAAALAAGISEARLQARAGAAVAAHTQKLRPDGLVTVLVGVGNNGRDAWVAACALGRVGREVRLYLAPRHALTEGEIRAIEGLGGQVLLHSGADTLEKLARWLEDSAVAVDGLLGIGAHGAPRPPLADIARTLNAVRTSVGSRLRVLAVDVPSGIDADSGAAEGECVQADVTVVLGGLKQGLLRFPAAARAGVLLAGDIGLPPVEQVTPSIRTLDRGLVMPDAPRRPVEGHKGSFGRVVVVGGSRDYYGAPYLAGAAALRSGCGLLAFAVAPPLQAVLAGLLPEATYLVLPDNAPVDRTSKAAATVLQALRDAQALLIGPGLGRSEGAMQLVESIVVEREPNSAGVPAVIDADALFALAQRPALLDYLGPGVVLTPHHGEMARLTGQETGAIAASPWDVARDAARRWGAVVVLKGPFTVVAVPSGEAWVWPRANPALATGGTGDVLAGTIAGLLAQGLDAAAAARVSVYVHATAALAHLAAAGTDLLLASDLPAAIARQLGQLRAERGDPGTLTIEESAWT
jgi:NAD(P)H-hydrate epimerase